MNKIVGNIVNDWKAASDNSKQFMALQQQIIWDLGQNGSIGTETD